MTENDRCRHSLSISTPNIMVRVSSTLFRSWWSASKVNTVIPWRRLRRNEQLSGDRDERVLPRPPRTFGYLTPADPVQLNATNQQHMISSCRVVRGSCSLCPSKSTLLGSSRKGSRATIHHGSNRTRRACARSTIVNDESLRSLQRGVGTKNTNSTTLEAPRPSH
jgi:hypothetical protein